MFSWLEIALRERGSDPAVPKSRPTRTQEYGCFVSNMSNFDQRTSEVVLGTVSSICLHFSIAKLRRWFV